MLSIQIRTRIYETNTEFSHIQLSHMFQNFWAKERGAHYTKNINENYRKSYMLSLITESVMEKFRGVFYVPL